MSSTGAVNATPVAPVWVEVGITVDLDTTTAPGNPVRIIVPGIPPVWATPDEALDLAVRLMQVANDARAAGA